MNLRRLFLPVLLAFGLLTFLIGKASAEDDRSGIAVTAAQNWMKMIDAGKYNDSYLAGCDALHEMVPKDRWILVLRTLRESWGPVLSRQVVSQVVKPDGVNGLTGQCMVITFNTSFKLLDQGQEEVVLKLDGGRWFGAGYKAGAKPRPLGTPVREPSARTDVQTQIAKPSNAR